MTALDELQAASFDLFVLTRKEHPPTWEEVQVASPEEVQVASAKLREKLSAFIDAMRKLYDSAILVTSEFKSLSLAAEAWKDLHDKFGLWLGVVEQLPMIDPESNSLFKDTIGVMRSIVDQADQEYRSYSETAYLLGSPANAERLREAIEEAKSGKLKEMSLEAVRSLTGGTV